jgi:predicted RNA-binding protein YlqC (UPF0109 family)
MSDIDQQFIEYVVKSLVGKPDAVHIDRRIDEKGVLLELTVDPEDLGRVIGKRGATAQSLRTLLRALGTKNDARYNLKIIDNGVGEHARSSDNEDAPAPSRDDSTAKDDDQTAASAPDEPAADTPEPDTADSEPESEAKPDKPEAEAPAKAENTEEDRTSDRLRAAREELADLDDLDV